MKNTTLSEQTQLFAFWKGLENQMRKQLLLNSEQMIIWMGMECFGTLKQTNFNLHAVPYSLLNWFYMCLVPLL